MKGSTFKRGDAWCARWSIDDAATGERRQYSKGGFRLKSEARAHLNTQLGKIADGLWRPDSPLTVSELLLEHWLEAMESRDLRPATMVQYRKVVGAWINPNIGATKVNALTAKKVNELVRTLRTKKTKTGRDGLSPRSIQLAVGILKAACAWGVANDLLARNPVAGVKRPRGKSRVMQVWTTGEARQFLEFTKEGRLAFAWTLLLTRGLRRGELCGLRWSDVGLETGSITINHTRVTVAGRAVDGEPKTAAGRRAIPLDASLSPILRAHKATQAREKLAAGGAYEESGYLVADELGRPYHPDSVSGWFDDRVKLSGLPRIRLHDTRHTAASLMLASNVPVKVVSEMLGHASPTITLAIYAHVMPGMAEEAGAALSASLLN
jgi:integrase